MANNPENFPRSPLENVLHFVPQGHEKALKHAFYNAAGMIFVLFGAAATAAVYFVLQPFVKPLLWAVLFGSVLHPFKQGMATVARRWLQALKLSGTPLTVGVLLLPVGVVEYTSQTVADTVQRYVKSMATVTVALIAVYVVFAFTPESILQLGVFFKDLLVYHTHDFLGYFSSIWVSTLAVGYFLVVVFYWTPSTNRLLCSASVFIWIIMLLHFATVLGSLRGPVFVAIMTLMMVGFWKEVSDVRAQYKLHATDEDSLPIPSHLETAWSMLTGEDLPISSQASSIRFAVQDLSAASESDASSSAPASINASPAPKKRALSRQLSVGNFFGKNEDKMSNVYIYSLIWACILVQVWKHVWIWPILLLIVVYLLVKRLGSNFGLWSFLLEKLRTTYNFTLLWLEQRKDALLPAPVRGVGKLTLRGDSKVASILEQSVDILTTIGTIVLLIFFVLTGTVFLLVQIHGESMHMIQVTSNLINNSVVHNPDIQGLLPEGVSKMLDSMFENAYENGKEWIVKMVKHIINEQDEEKSHQIEKQVLELWDRVCQAWMESGQTTNTQVGKGNGSVIENFMAELGAPGFLDFSAMVGFVKENVDTFMAVLDASWTVLKGNISLAFSALTATLSLLFGGGTALLNFLFSFIIFVTALFYLLSASGERYKPIVLCNKLSPPGNGNRFTQAFEEAINGVFAASFKMAFFYGLWTWLIHRLFQVKMVYIPSALAAIFGAMPFLGTFWAVIPAVLELWLIQGQGIKAVLMFVCQLLPMSCVDTAIYSEIKGGGHPYLTGLAVAGGMFCFGAEGAIIGPLLLCCLFVAMNMYGNIMQESPINDPTKRLLSKAYLMKRTTSIM